MRNRSSDLQASATVELVLIAPLLMLLVLFVFSAGRSGEAIRQVQHAADHGARAASQVSASKRGLVGVTAAREDLRLSGHSCTDQEIQVMAVKIGDLDAVRVTVSCRIDQSGLDLLGLSSRRVMADSVEVIDRYRAR